MFTTTSITLSLT